MLRSLLSVLEVCDCPFCAGVTEQSTSALPFSEGGGKNSHSSAPWELRARGPEPFALARVVRLQVVSGVRVRPCARESLSVGSWPPALVRASPQKIACPQALDLEKSFCATVERWECRLLVHERDSQFSVCPQTADCTHSLTRCPHRESSFTF